MIIQRFWSAGLIAALAALGTYCATAAAVDIPPVPEPTGEDVEILTRGPVHEAFAETVTFDPQPGVIVARVPPAAIEELPPDQKPEGNNVAWIPGYWAWDDDGGDFLWVSGIWRALPPGRQWVPGYWAESGKGAQWTSGYWADAKLTEAEYLPEPPQSVEAGPNIEAPSADHAWLPGCWIWHNERYAWRPGFWTPVQPNWVWTPAHYQWAPRGYVFVDGYWDYAVQRRGVLFAPVSFQQSVYTRRGFSYTPSTVINLGVFADHLFLRPNYGHYYYGDYYGANYTKAGFYPSFSFHSSRHGYDPIYAQHRWDHRQDRDWERRVQADYQHRRDHEDARPPRTFRAQQELAKRGLTGRDTGRVFAQPLDQYRTAKENAVRFQKMNTEDRQRYGHISQEVRTLREQRQKLEMREGEPTVERPARPFQPARVKIPRSPLVGPGADELGKEFAPPKTYDFPKPDLRIEPNARKPLGEVQPPQRQPRQERPERQPKPEPRVKPTPPPQVERNLTPPTGDGQPAPQGGSRGQREEGRKDKPRPK